MGKKDSILKSTSYVMLVLIFVKLVGFVKQAVIAAYFGTSLDMDLYLIASDFISETGMVFFSSLSVSFLTMFVTQMEEKGKREANIFLSNTLLSFVLIAIGVIIFIWTFIDPITHLIASGYEDSQRAVIGQYIRIISIVIINICVSNICTAALEGGKIFLPGKLIGIIQSVCLIIACVIGAERKGVYSLLYGLIIYYVVQNIFLLYFVLRNNKLYIKKFWRDSRVWQVVKMCVPLFVSNAVVQINIIVDKSIASHMPAGSVTALSYSHYLFSTMHSIIIGSFCTVIFSYFSGYVASKEEEKITEELKKGVGNLLLVLLPITTVCVINAKEIVRIVYARGVFDESSVTITAYALIGYVLGLVFVAMRDLLMQVYYAFQDTKIPMVNGIIGVGVNIVCSVLLARYWGVFGIAIADSIAYLLVFILIAFTIKKHLKTFCMFENDKILSQLVFAVGAGAGAGILMKWCLRNSYYLWGTVISTMTIIIVFFGILFWAKCPVLLQVQDKIYTKIKR